MKKILFGAIVLLLSIRSMASCGEQEGYKIALQKAIFENPIMKKSTVYKYKVLNTHYGHAYMVYFNKTTDATNAHMVLVTMDKNCKVLDVGAPTKSTFYLKSKLDVR